MTDLTALRVRYGEVADELERELRALGLWATPAPDQPVTGAFGAPASSFPQWLEHVLCPRLRQVAQGRAEPPSSSQVATGAVRNLDGIEGAETVIEILARLDALVNRPTVS